MNDANMQLVAKLLA